MTRAAIFDLDDTLYEREQFVQSGFAAVAPMILRQEFRLKPRNSTAHGSRRGR